MGRVEWLVGEEKGWHGASSAYVFGVMDGGKRVWCGGWGEGVGGVVWVSVGRAMVDFGGVG